MSHDSLFSLCSSLVDGSSPAKKAVQNKNYQASGRVSLSSATVSTNDTSGYASGPENPACYLHTDESILPFLPIPGLYYMPSIISEEQEQVWMKNLAELDLFGAGRKNQLMYFSNPTPASCSSKKDSVHVTHSFLNWPEFLVDLIERLPSIITKINPSNLDGINEAMFGPAKATLAWQVIVNLYRPSEGIAQHIDLVDRFDDMILGLSLGSGVTMQFESLAKQQGTKTIERLYLEQRSGYLMTRESRYDWTHGILANELYDYVQDSDRDRTRRIRRTRTRVSFTIRRLKPGADLLGTNSRES